MSRSASEGALRVAVIGLGRVGSRFDEEPGRRSIWTHVGAYLAHPRSFELAAACEPDPRNAAAFHARCSGVPVHASVKELLDAERPEVVSICTPAESHAAVLHEVLEAPELRVVWCEKPLATRLPDAVAMVEACDRRGVALVVSHVRRWSPLWRRASERIEEGAVGRVRCVRVAMPNRLRTIGSHAVDLALLLGGKATGVVGLDLPELREEGESASAALIGLEGGAYAIIQVTGLKSRLLVEAEVVGDVGRLHVREDRGVIVHERFAPSASYAGYLQLQETETEEVEVPETFSPFAAIADEISEIAHGRRPSPTCGGSQAIDVHRVLAALEGEEESLVWDERRKGADVRG